MRRVSVLLAGIFFLTFVISQISAEQRRSRVGGCCDPCVSSLCGDCQRCTPLDPGPMQAMKIVMVPRYVTETRQIAATEYRQESRKRAYTVYKTVPVEEERLKTVVEWIPKKETKTVEYTVTIPVKFEETRDLTRTKRVWTGEEQQYRVKVPTLVEVEEEYTVRAPKLVDETFTYVVQVPVPVTRTLLRSVTNIIPVTKIRKVEETVPVTRNRLVNKESGYWENRVEETPQRDGRMKLVSKRVWVPNTIQEEIPVVYNKKQLSEIKYTVYEQRTEKVPYEYTHMCYQRQTRKGVKKKVVYVNETRTRPRLVAEYQDEVRTRVDRKLELKDEVVSTTFPVISYEKEKRAKRVTYTVKVPQTRVKAYKVTRYDRVPEQKIETYTVKVPVSVIKDVKVQVAKMVPQVVTVNIDPCASCANGCGRCRH